MRSVLLITLVAFCLIGTSIATPVRRDKNPLDAAHNMTDRLLGNTDIAKRDITRRNDDPFGSSAVDGSIHDTLEPSGNSSPFSFKRKRGLSKGNPKDTLETAKIKDGYEGSIVKGGK
ncbi:hypothetical protein G6F56_012399 [Rhizopus delemar]|nr:hypothetical protein G6F56_012399 [Rhizopus delemar]